MAAERRLLEESRNEAMILNVIHVLLLQRSFAAAIPERQLVVRLIAVLRKVVVVSHVGHVSYLFISGLEFTSRFLDFIFPLSESGK